MTHDSPIKRSEVSTNRKKSDDEAVDRVLDFLKSRREEHTEDEDEDISTFFHSMARSVRKLPRLKQCQIKQLLFRAVSEAEMEMEVAKLNRDSTEYIQSRMPHPIPLQPDSAGYNQYGMSIGIYNQEERFQPENNDLCRSSSSQFSVRCSTPRLQTGAWSDGTSSQIHNNSPECVNL